MTEPTTTDKKAAEELADELLLDIDTPERIQQVSNIIARYMQAEREAQRKAVELLDHFVASGIEDYALEARKALKGTSDE